MKSKVIVSKAYQDQIIEMIVNCNDTKYYPDNIGTFSVDVVYQTVRVQK